MPQRTFEPSDQIVFAHLSGDVNPLHLDAVAARRFLFGRPIVHGVHLLLWALDELWRDVPSVVITQLNAEFRAPVGVGDEVKLEVQASDRSAALTLLSNGQTSTTVTVDWTLAQGNSISIPTTGPKPRLSEWHANDIAEASGSLPLYLDGQIARRLFPHVARVLSMQQLATLTATTRLVGTECPGLNSVFHTLTMHFDSESLDSPELSYRVDHWDERFSSLRMNIESGSARGTVGAFLRPSPCEPTAFAQLQQLVGNSEFEDQCAVVLGGSRGLGAATAKILAAGGAHVILTYRNGQAEARALVEEIGRGGGSAECAHYEVTAPDQSEVFQKARAKDATHLYYFPTPHIFAAQQGKFSERLLAKFMEFYVTGFEQVLRHAVTIAPKLTGAYYPSSVAIQELPLNMVEYSVAKAAGEQLCRLLEKELALSIHIGQLPRTDTDQTQSLLPVDNADPVEVMISQLASMTERSLD